MMKRIFIFIICISTISLVFSQRASTYKDVVNAKNKKTYVVLTDFDSNFNTYIKSGIEKYWTFSKNIDYIPFSEFENLKNKSNYNFLMVASIQFSVGQSASGSTSKSYDYNYSFYNEDEFKKNIVDYKIITGVVSKYRSMYLTLLHDLDDSETSNFLNKRVGFSDIGLDKHKIVNTKAIESFVNIINTSLTLVEENKLAKGFLKLGTLEDYTSQTVPSEKTIIFLKDYIPFGEYQNEKEIKSFLDNDFKIVDIEEFEELLKMENEKYLFWGYWKQTNFSYQFLYNYKGDIEFYANLGIYNTTMKGWMKKALKSLNN